MQALFANRYYCHLSALRCFRNSNFHSCFDRHLQIQMGCCLGPLEGRRQQLLHRYLP